MRAVRTHRPLLTARVARICVPVVVVAAAVTVVVAAMCAVSGALLTAPLVLEANRVPIAVAVAHRLARRGWRSSHQTVEEAGAEVSLESRQVGLLCTQNQVHFKLSNWAFSC